MYLDRFNFLLSLQELTARYDREVEAVQRVFSEVNVTLQTEATEGSSTCVPASHHRIQQRLDVLKVITAVALISVVGSVNGSFVVPNRKQRKRFYLPSK